MTQATLTAVDVALCPLDDVPEGLGRAFRVGEKLIAVFRSRSGNVYAVDGLCPHKKGPLADGMLVGEQIVCPFHAFRYHGTTGECDQDNICSIKAYPADVRLGMIHLSMTTG